MKRKFSTLITHIYILAINEVIEQFLIPITCYFYYLSTVRTGCEHGTFLPKVDVEIVRIDKLLVIFAAELTDFGLFIIFLLLSIWRRIFSLFGLFFPLFSLTLHIDVRRDLAIIFFFIDFEGWFVLKLIGGNSSSSQYFINILASKYFFYHIHLLLRNS